MFDEIFDDKDEPVKGFNMNSLFDKGVIERIVG
jgi:hypothetical protein